MTSIDYQVKIAFTFTEQKKWLSTMPASSKDVIFPGHNYLLTTGTDDLKLWLSSKRRWEW